MPDPPLCPLGSLPSYSVEFLVFESNRHHSRAISSGANRFCWIYCVPANQNLRGQIKLHHGNASNASSFVIFNTWCNAIGRYLQCVMHESQCQCQILRSELGIPAQRPSTWSRIPKMKLVHSDSRDYLRELVFHISSHMYSCSPEFKLIILHTLVRHREKEKNECGQKRNRWKIWHRSRISRRRRLLILSRLDVASKNLEIL